MPQQDRSKRIQIMLHPQSELPPKMPLPHPHPSLLLLQQKSKMMIQIMEPHPHPELLFALHPQFVAVKSLIVKPPK